VLDWIAGDLRPQQTLQNIQHIAVRQKPEGRFAAILHDVDATGDLLTLSIQQTNTGLEGGVLMQLGQFIFGVQ